MHFNKWSVRDSEGQVIEVNIESRIWSAVKKIPMKMYVVQEKPKCNHKKMHMIIKLCSIICMENNAHMLFKMSNCYNG